MASAPAIDGYTDLRVTGRGATATVYRATQEGFDRAVALKVLNVDISDRRAQKRFQRERALNGRLSDHPNVVTVLDAGFVDGRYPYLAMELFEQGSLTDRLLTQGPFDVALALHVGVRIAGALESAHRLGILHRDVKPQNVLLSRYGEPALADFGIAAILEMEHSLTAALTPVHAAPEVLEGADPTAAADVYALGSTIYTTLTGVPPFAGPAGEGMLAQLLRITTSAPPPIARSDVPDALVTALHTAMAKQPADRFPSAAAFGAALQRVQRDLGLAVTGLPVDGDHATPPADEAPPAKAAAPLPPPTAAPTSPPSAAPPDDATEQVPVAASPVASPATPAPTSTPLPVPMAAREHDPPVDAIATGMPVDTPTVIGRQRQPALPEPSRPRRRWIVPVTAAAALALGAGGAVVAVSALGDDDPAPAPTTGPAGTGSVPSTLPDDISAFAPFALDAVTDTTSVLLRWRDRTGGTLPQVIYIYLTGSTEPIQQPVDAGKTSAVVKDLAPDTPACFIVSAVVALGDGSNPAVTANSESKCINNATAELVPG